MGTVGGWGADDLVVHDGAKSEAGGGGGGGGGCGGGCSNVGDVTAGKLGWSFLSYTLRMGD